MKPRPKCIFYIGQKVRAVYHDGSPIKWDFLQFVRGKSVTISGIACQKKDWCPEEKLENPRCDKCQQQYISLRETNEVSWRGLELKPYEGGNDMNKAVMEVFENTKEAVIVDKYFGSDIPENIIGVNILKVDPGAVLKEALNKEERERKRVE